MKVVLEDVVRTGPGICWEDVIEVWFVFVGFHSHASG